MNKLKNSLMKINVFFDYTKFFGWWNKAMKNTIK